MTEEADPAPQADLPLANAAGWEVALLLFDAPENGGLYESA
jgi:hypothetical protein